MAFWPYKILKRTDDNIRKDLENIARYFHEKGKKFDMVVFIPNAGLYLSSLAKGIFGENTEVNYVTVRRASTVSRSNFIKNYIFRKKILADIMRHLDVLLRLIKYRLGKKQKMVSELEVGFDVKDKHVLVIDDDIATGATLHKVKSILLSYGPASVTTGCISNHFLPKEIEVDYSVYEYVLLRTKNSRDYNAN